MKKNAPYGAGKGEESMFFRVYDVGDGNYIQLFSEFMNSILTVDFGLKQQDEQNRQFICSFLYSSQLLISHYHQDHYRGLIQLEDNSANIKKLYYPRIPDFAAAATLKKQVLFVEFIQNVNLGSESGSPAKDLVNLINRKNRRDFKRKAVKQGDSIYVGDVKFDVIWPPEKVSDEKEKALLNGVKEIEEIIAENEILRKLWEDFDKNVDEVFSSKEEYVEKNAERTKDTHLLYKEIESYKDISDDIIKTLSEKVRKITNRFSVCLYLHNKFLFLGDLESNEINRCIEFIKQEYQTNHVNNLISAHHGSHWGNKLLDIYAENVILSNGKNLSTHFKEGYKRIGGNIYSTYLNGNLTFSFNHAKFFYHADYPYWYLPWFLF